MLMCCKKKIFKIEFSESHFHKKPGLRRKLDNLSVPPPCSVMQQFLKHGAVPVRCDEGKDFETLNLQKTIPLILVLVEQFSFSVFWYWIFCFTTVQKKNLFDLNIHEGSCSH